MRMSTSDATKTRNNNSNDHPLRLNIRLLNELLLPECNPFFHKFYSFFSCHLFNIKTEH